jgi:hypothetical protein
VTLTFGIKEDNMLKIVAFVVAVAASNQHIFVFLVEERFLVEGVINADRS